MTPDRGTTPSRRRPRLKRRRRLSRLLSGRGEASVRRQLVRLRRRLAAAQRSRHRLMSEQNPPEELLLDADNDVVWLSAAVSRLESLLEESDGWNADADRTGAGEVVRPGTVIELVNAATGARAEYRIVGDRSSASSNVISVGSRVGQALLGRRVGSLVTLVGDDGRLERARVSRIGPLETDSS